MHAHNQNFGWSRNPSMSLRPASRTSIPLTVSSGNMASCVDQYQQLVSVGPLFMVAAVWGVASCVLKRIGLDAPCSGPQFLVVLLGFLHSLLSLLFESCSIKVCIGINENASPALRTPSPACAKIFPADDASSIALESSAHNKSP